MANDAMVEPCFIGQALKWCGDETQQNGDPQ